jgi:NAD kinase
VSVAPRAVLVHRRTEYEELLERHGTRGQAAFFLSTRGRDLEEVDARHAAQMEAMTAVTAAIPLDWRRGLVERVDLPRFLFDPEDIVVIVGQDGLVANVAKYLQGQVVIGFNPDPTRNPGILVPHQAGAAAELLEVVTSPEVGRRIEARTMVEGVLDDGQRVRALNELYIGHPSH